MSPEVQDDVVGLVARMLDAAHAKELTITWFGGEPLMGTDVIESLSPRLIRLAEERGCEYKAWIFTNGYLLTEDVVDLLLRCHVNHVHIPLDGVGATNDATRRLVGGGPTYQKIVDNIGLLKPPIRTLIRANVHALPELWTFQSVVGFVLAAVLGISNRITDILINSLGMAVTSANLTQCLFTWQGVLLVAVWVVALPAVVAIELFAEISLCNDLLYGKPGRIIESLKNGMLSLKRFLTFRGFWTVLYVLLATPLCGVGFSVSVTDELHIPHFIVEAIFATPLYRVAHFLLIAVLVAVGIIHVFVMHAVVIDGMTPSEARSWSLKTMRAKGFQVLGSMVLPFLFWFFLSLVVYMLLIGVPTAALEIMWPRVAGVELSVQDLLSGTTLTSAQEELLTYRILAALTVVCGSSLNGLMLLLSGSYLMLRFTRCYDELAHGKRELWPARTRRHAYLKKIGFMIISGALLAVLSVGVGAFFDALFYWDPVGIVGHRAAGT